MKYQLFTFIEVLEKVKEANYVRKFYNPYIKYKKCLFRYKAINLGWNFGKLLFHIFFAYIVILSRAE